MTNETLSDKIAPPRTCATCACSIIEKHHVTGNDMQMFCRRNTVMAQPARMERPKIDPKTGQAMVRQGRRDEPPTPIMETFTDLLYLYTPTLATLTCFDGWRPMGTLPGDHSYKSSDLETLYANAMAKLSNDMRLQRDGVLADYPDHSTIDPKKN